MPQIDPYIAQVSKRIVEMFERYSENIDPEGEDFLLFVSKYLANKDAKEPKTIPYSQLYGHIKEAIREYLREKERPKIQKEHG